MNLDKLTSKVIEYSFYTLFILVPLILTPYNYELFEFNKMLLVYFLTITISASWIIKSIINHKFTCKKTPFDIPLMLFLLSQILSTIFSINPHTSLWGYYSRFHGGLISTISYLILFYAYVTHMKTKTTNSLKVTLSTALIVASYAIAEHFGIDKNLWVQDVQNRVFSTLGQPNWLAAYLLTLIPIPMALLLTTRKKLLKTYYLLLIIIFYLALLYTKSRSGLAGLAVTLVIFTLLTIFKTRLKAFKLKQIFKPFSLVIISFLTITLLTGTLYTPSIKQLLQSKTSAPVPTNPDKATPPAITLGGSKSSDIRKVVWQGAVDVFKQYPVFGSGVATFGYSYYNHRPIEHNALSEWDFLYNKAHNEFLNFLSTTGTLGLFAYSLIIIWFTAWSLTKFRKSKSYLIPAFISGFLGLAVSNFFGFAVVPVAIFFFLFPAFALDILKPKSTPTTTKTTPTKHYILNNSHYLTITVVIFLGLFLQFKLINWWRADFHYSRGKDYVKLNQIQEGFQHLQKAVTLMPSEPQFHSDYSEVLAKMALIYHQQLNTPPSDIPPDQRQQFTNQFTNLINQATNQAIQETDLVIKKNPVHLSYWKSRIKVFLLLSTIDKQYEQPGLEAFQAAIDLSPTDPKLRYNLSLLYNQMNQTGLAEQVLIEVINLKPDYEPARLSLGSLYQQTNRYDKAREQYQYILEYLNPDNQKVKNRLLELD